MPLSLLISYLRQHRKRRVGKLRRHFRIDEPSIGRLPVVGSCFRFAQRSCACLRSVMSSELTNRCERFFRALAEFFRRWTEFAFSRDYSDRDPLGLRCQVQAFDSIAKSVIERIRSE